MEDKQISSATVWAGVAWAAAFALTLAGTIILVSTAESLSARSWGLACYAHSMVLTGVATCLTIRVMLRRQTKWLLSRIELEADIDQRLRRVR